MKSRAAVITGATGYIGSQLVRRLLVQGRPVYAIVRSSSDTRVLRNLKGRLHLHKYDGSAKSLTDVYNKVGKATTFHLAAQTSSERAKDASTLIQANILFGVHLLGAIRRPAAHIFINTGTFCQHGEDGKYQPMNLYAATKQAFFDILTYYRQTDRLKTMTLELYDVYGPSDPRNKLFSQLARHTRFGRKLAMSPGHQKLDMIYVDDVLDAYVHAEDLLEKRRFLPQSCAVSFGRTIPLRKIVRLYERLSGKSLKIGWGMNPYRPGTIMSPWKGKRLPGWRAKTSLEKGIQLMLTADGI